MRKRITSLLLTLVMLLSLVPAMGVTASAADDTYGYGNIKDWSGFKSYLSSPTSRDLTLENDIDYTTGYDDDAIIIKKSQKLDLNGHKIRIDASKRAEFYNLITIRSGEFTLYDSKGGGAIEVEFARDSKGHCIIMISPDSAGAPAKFTMNGGTLTRLNPIDSNVYGNNGCISDNYFVPFKGGERPQITINGGTINCAYDWNNRERNTISGVQYMPTALLLRYSQLTVNGGTFNGIVWTDELSWREGDAEPRVLLNGGVFNFPFAVTGLLKNKTQMVIDGARFNDGLYVAKGIKLLSYEGNEPAMLIKSGVFDASGQNLKLDIRSVTADGWYTAQGRQKAIKYAMKLFPNSAIKLNGNIYTSENIGSRVKYADTDGYYLNLNLKGPIEVIPNAWGMKSVTLDGNPINYAKDWYGAVEEMDNSTAHTLKFEWYPLAQELKDAGYTYRANFDCYTVGSNTPTTSVPISATATEYSHTIHAGEAPSVYPFDLQLNLDKNGSSVGIISNQHIVKLVVTQAPVVEPDPTIEGSVYYTSGIVCGSPISIAASVTPAEATKAYQWQRSTDGGSTWTNIEGANDSRYTPTADDMGDTVRIRVKVTAEGYLGEIVGAAVKVSKAANNNYPEVIQLEAVQDSAGNYTGFKITNFDSDCEYVYSTTDTLNWSANQISSATVTGLTSNATYYVFARFKETATHTAGSIVSKNSIMLYDYVPLDRVSLEGYDSGNTIYIKKGESVTLKVSADPSNANSWSEITFKESGTATGCITVDNEKIAASTGTDTPFPNDHTITIKGVSTGSATLDASYSGPAQPYYGRWNVVVYDDSTVANALRLENVYAYEDITLSVNDEAELPTELPKLLPENSGYHLEWRIVKVGMGAAYMTSDDNITLENDKIKPKAAYTGSASTRLELVAVKEGETNVKSFSQTSRFNVTVTAAPVIELTGLTVAPAKVNLANVGDTYQLSAVKQPVNAAGSLTWESSNTGVATVDSTGKVTAKAQGTAVITVTCGSKSASCTVTVGHTHDTDGRDWMYMDPGMHIQTCTAGDDFKVEAHDFSAWTKVDDTNHSRTCSKCKKSGETANYTETANHNWQWVVDTAATPNAAGKQHEECVDCHAKRSENTPIPMLTSIMVEHLIVAKPVKDAAAAAASTTDSTYTVANTEWMAADGTPLAIGGKFQPGTVYTVKITLETAGADVFSVKSTYNTIEGKTATVSPNLTGDNHADSVILTYTFDATEGSTGGSTGGGGGSGGGGVTTYAITVKDSKNGDVTASHKSAAKGTTVTLTVDPDKGYVLDTLTVLDGNNKDLKLTEKNGKYTFTMPASKVTVAATFKASAPTGKNPFIDVPAGSYYEDAVVWAVEKGITSGTSAVTFDPNGICTRAQAVTFLWRAAGSPAPKSMNSFADVPADAYYAKAVAWAVENGITSGTGGGKFSPNATCTRAQIVTFLYRAAGSPAVSGGNAFSDVKAGAYYADAVTWAANKGITGGIGNGLFGSDNNCTRAQIVTFLYRYME